MSRQPAYIFVLWGSHFDEASAVHAITSLRGKGHCVKVVGIDGSQPKGSHGLGLVTDITLSEAMELAEYAVGVVVPCQEAEWLEREPRVQEFLEKCGDWGAVGAMNGSWVTS